MNVKERVYRNIKFRNDFFINKAIIYNSIIYKTNKWNDYIRCKGDFHWDFKRFIIYWFKI